MTIPNVEAPMEEDEMVEVDLDTPASIRTVKRRFGDLHVIGTREEIVQKYQKYGERQTERPEESLEFTPTFRPGPK